MAVTPPLQAPPIVAAVPSAPKTPLSVAVQPAYGHSFIVLLLAIMSGYAYRVWAQNNRDFGSPAPTVTTAPVILVPAVPTPPPPILPAPVAPPVKPDPATPPTGPSPSPAPPVALATTTAESARPPHGATLAGFVFDPDRGYVPR